jgi:hypothetical protein
MCSLALRVMAAVKKDSGQLQTGAPRTHTRMQQQRSLSLDLVRPGTWANTSVKVPPRSIEKWKSRPIATWLAV